jgi:ribosomal protein L37E
MLHTVLQRGVSYGWKNDELASNASGSRKAARELQTIASSCRRLGKDSPPAWKGLCSLCIFPACSSYPSFKSETVVADDLSGFHAHQGVA